MQSSSFTFADLSRFLKRAPKLRTYIIPSVVLLVLDYIILKNLSYLSFLFVLPLLITFAIDYSMFKLMTKTFPRRRINFLDFLSFFICNVYFIILKAAFPGYLNIFFDIVLSFSVAAMLRSMIFFLYISESIRRIFVPSLIYTLALFPGLILTHSPLEPILLFIGTSMIFLLGGYFFAFVNINSITTEFGQSPISVMNFLLNTGSRSEHDAYSFLKSIYNKEKETIVQTIDIKDITGKRKVVLVFPYVHPGPFGSVGTSNLPYKLQSLLDDIGSDLMVFHTTTTNSNNSVREEDIERISHAVRESMRHSNYVSTITRFRKLRAGKHTLGIIRFGDYGIGVMIPEREKFDDVSLSEGMKMISEMKKMGAADFAVLDAQTHFSYGAKPLENLGSIVSTAKREFFRMVPKDEARIGYSRVEGNSSALGPMGIQCIVIETSQKKQALILTDSNNILDSVINAARSSIKDVDEVEFFTTDNHFVNAGTLDMNPLGEKDNVQEIVELMKKAVSEASQDVSPCSMGFGSSAVKVSMGDESSFQNLLNKVSKTVRRAKYGIVLTVFLCLFLSISISDIIFYSVKIF